MVDACRPWICRPGLHILACRHHRAAYDGAWWLGVLGFALAAPAATERAAAIFEEIDPLFAAEVMRGQIYDVNFGWDPRPRREEKNTPAPPVPYGWAWVVNPDAKGGRQLRCFSFVGTPASPCCNRCGYREHDHACGQVTANGVARCTKEFGHEGIHNAEAWIPPGDRGACSHASLATGGRPCIKTAGHLGPHAAAPVGPHAAAPVGPHAAAPAGPTCRYCGGAVEAEGQIHAGGCGSTG